MKGKILDISYSSTGHSLGDGQKVLLNEKIEVMVERSENVTVKVELSKQLIEEIKHEASVKADIILSKSIK